MTIPETRTLVPVPAGFAEQCHDDGSLAVSQLEPLTRVEGSHVQDRGAPSGICS